MKPRLFTAGPRSELKSKSTIILSVSFLLAMTALVIYPLRNPQLYDFRFNIYGLLSALPVTINVWIIYKITRLRVRSEDSIWFVLYTCGAVIAGVGEALQRFSIHPDQAIYWFQVNGIGFLLLPISYYLFVFSYARPLRSQSPMLIPSLIVSAFIMITFFVGTNQFYNLNLSAIVHYPWGYQPPNGPAFPILVLWVEILLFVALATLIAFYRRVNSDLLKKQSRMYIIAILIPIVVGSLTDGILPLMGNNTIVPLTTFLSAMTSIVAYYGLRRYRLFQINPTVFAENVIRSMHEAVVVTDTHYKIDFANQEAERIFGVSAGELSGADISRKFTVESWRTVSLYGDPGAPDVAGIDELQIVNKQNLQVPVRVQVSQLDPDTPNEAYIFIIADISDITASYHKLEDSTARIQTQNNQLQENQETMARLLAESKDLQTQLQHEKENVEHTVAVRTTELRDARDKLQASEQMKSEFIMLSSHNLRTPLSIMQNSVEMLEADAKLTPEQRGVLIDGLSHSTEQLAGFVEDLLTIASLEAGDGLSHAPTKLEDIILPLVKRTEDIASTKGLKFLSDPIPKGVVLNANVLRLRGAIQNILQNAINFTDRGEIRLGLVPVEAGLRISIQDTGIGISPEELPRLFTKFHRATPTLTFDYQGEGLGLYLTKLVVEEHHGQITAESTPGQGSTFTIVLPVIPRQNTGSAIVSAPQLAKSLKPTT